MLCFKCAPNALLQEGPESRYGSSSVAVRLIPNNLRRRIVKLYLQRVLSAQITSLALKLVPGHPSQWPDWILSVVTILSGGGAPPEYLLEFLEIAAEEYGSSDLVATSK